MVKKGNARKIHIGQKPFEPKIILSLVSATFGFYFILN